MKRHSLLITAVLTGAVALEEAAPSALGTSSSSSSTPKCKLSDSPAHHTANHVKVDVEDNYYSPHKITVNKCSEISWVWNDGDIEDHDVKLSSGPAGESHFWSEPGGTGYVYKRTLAHPGTYKIICTFHDEMTMTITVRH